MTKATLVVRKELERVIKVMRHIYMDHAATTPIHPEVLDTMYPLYTEVFGNPSSIHSYGRKARQQIDQARRVIANRIGADEHEIIFTSGGTEADNLALIGTAFANKHKGNHIITTEQEHHAILHAARFLEDNGFLVTYLPSYENGQIKVDDLKEALTDDTILVSIMSVNNETGIIQPIDQIGEILIRHQAYFHTDAVQALGLIPIDVKKMNIDLLSASSHKINGPKGSGFMYVKNGMKLQPMYFGGEQERKRRPGTENVIQIIGLKKATTIAIDTMEQRYNEYNRLKQLFLNTLRQTGIQFQVNGQQDLSVPTIVNISFPGTNVETLLTSLDLNGIAASSGSACTAGSIEPSHVLVAMFGENDDRTANSIRFSFGLNQTTEIIEEAANRIAEIVEQLMI